VPALAVGAEAAEEAVADIGVGERAVEIDDDEIAKIGLRWGAQKPPSGASRA
jgi:hypothetical protein